MQSETNRAAIAELIQAKKSLSGGLLPILHDIQDRIGYIPDESVAVIAKELNLSRAEVHGVITFYHHFHTKPVGQNVVQVCRAEACRAMGSDDLWQHACQKILADDASTSLHEVYCLGLCSSSPAIAINDKPYARINVAKFDRLLANTRK